MGVRHKQTIVNTLYKHFKEFELPVDIEYKSYVQIVGVREAVSPVAIKRSFKAWKYALKALTNNYPDILKKPEPVIQPTLVKKPEPVVEAPKPTGLDALKAMSTNKDAKDE